MHGDSVREGEAGGFGMAVLEGEPPGKAGFFMQVDGCTIRLEEPDLRGRHGRKLSIRFYWLKRDGKHDNLPVRTVSGRLRSVLNAD